MDSHKLDIAAREAEVSPISTSIYKQIPEEDMEEQELTKPKHVAKINSSSLEADGADEKMLPDDKLAPNSNLTAGEVKFTTNEKQNGDAKLDIGDLKTTFVGMGKEELMKYANDPFWVRLRWTLFILFWLLWAGMLVGAVLIIIAAPKCSSPDPRTWWEEGPLSEVKLDVTLEKLKTMKENGVKGIIADWPLDTYQSVDSSAEYIELLKNANDVDMNVIVGLEPGYSRLFFNDSESKNDAVINYYIWRDSKGQNDSGASLPPNNWISPSNRSSWEYSPIRGQFYLAPFDKPQLDFRNPKVQEEFVKVLDSFLKAGVKGFCLNRVPYLLVDETFKDEFHADNPSFTVGQYGFYNHDKTMNNADLGPLVKSWKKLVRNATEDGVLMLADDVSNVEPYKVNGTLAIDLPKNSRVFGKPITSGAQLMADLNTTFGLLGTQWTVWENLNSGLEQDVVDIITLMLPGVTILPSDYTVDKELLNYRKSPSIMYGGLEQYVVANDTTFAFIRVQAGNPAYLVAVNPTDESVVVNFPKETNNVVSDEVTVVFFSKNYNASNVELKVKIKSSEVPITPKSALILTYVPKA